MALIIPAILEKDRISFDDKLFIIERILGVEKIQVDFCDGQFVPTTSLNVREFDVLNPAFTWEAHLMIKNPTDFLDYKMAGFNTIILHYEAFDSEENLEKALEEIVAIGLTPAVAINPETPVSVLRYFTDTIKQFTVLSVHPGTQGAEFLPDSLSRIASLRELAPHAIIEVDGGIKQTNISSVIGVGADNIAIGSALFETDNAQNDYDHLIASASHSVIKK